MVSRMACCHIWKQWYQRRVREFNEAYLLKLLHHLHSGRFGDFFLNSEREREEAAVRSRAPSIWPWLLDPYRVDKFRNPNYNHYDCPILPYCTTDGLEIWAGYYQRYHAEYFQRLEHDRETRMRCQKKLALKRENKELREKIGDCQRWQQAILDTIESNNQIVPTLDLHNVGGVELVIEVHVPTATSTTDTTNNSISFPSNTFDSPLGRRNTDESWVTITPTKVMLCQRETVLWEDYRPCVEIM
eukprot:TRINITY_DN7944_c0_g1_i6.p1 TRINITY_DN7944_c0_g1~~TRINITY_DN7944_c0_g1_i6.p1  ORF type:complete len:244 (+),score=56.04 TRINITY_DN7944_c0_g1_i6:429-1160(+)